MLGMSGWLKTVITVILLATFVDLLLPSSKMQRYARTVMSLFILLTLLTPVVQLFQRSWEPERLFSLVETEQIRMAAAEPSGGAIPSLEAIQRKADQLKAVNAQQEKKLVEAELASQIRDRLQGETELQIAAVTVTTATDKQNKPYIQDVELTLGPPKSAAVSAQPSAPSGTAGGTPDGTASRNDAGTSSDLSGKPLNIEIKPVDPVRIRIGEDSDHHTSAAAVPAAREALPPEYRQDQAVILRILGKEFQLPADRIRTSYAGAAKAS